MYEEGFVFTDNSDRIWKNRCGNLSKLSRASWVGNLEDIKCLMEKGANVNMKESYGFQPIHVAVRFGHIDVVEFFLSKDVDIDCCDYDGLTPLHHASRWGYIEIVKLLLKKGAAVDVKNSEGQTPILLAAKHSHRDIVEVLLQTALDIDYCPPNKWRLFHVASSHGWLKIAQHLAIRGVELDPKNDSGETPILLAAKNSHRDIVEFLISLGANVTCHCNNGNITVLHLAARNGWLEVAQSLVQKGADPNAKTSCGCTPLFYTVYRRHQDVFECLINLGTNVNCVDQNLWTVLHHVSKEGWYNAVELLVQNGADVNAINSNGKTPLLLAAQNSHELLVNILIHHGADINMIDPNKYTLMHYAAKEGWLNKIQYLVNNGAKPDVITSCGYTPLLLAAESDRRHCVEFLIDLTGNVACCTKDLRWTVLHYASRHGWLEVVQSLVKRGTELNVKNSQGITPLLLAAEFSPREGIIELLIDSGANLDVCNKENWSVLHYAARYGWTSIAQSLVERGANLNSITGSRADTPLISAARYQHVDIVNLLINAGADIRGCDSAKFSVSYFAVLNGWADVLRSLSKRGVDFNVVDYGSRHETPILVAAQNSHKGCVQFFLEIGVTNHGWTKQYWTVLHFAAQNKWLDVVQCLVERGYNVNDGTRSGDTPIHLACTFRFMSETESLIDASIEIVKFLVNNGANINAKDGSDRTPLCSACDALISKRNLLKLLPHLFKFGADSTIVDCMNGTPFHRELLKRDNIDVIKLFIENGAYFSDEDYCSEIDPVILQDVKLCSQAYLNKFNRVDLRVFYQLYPGILPPVEKMEIWDNIVSETIIQDIEETVKRELLTNGNCNVLKMRPIVLKVLCVKSLINFYSGPPEM